MKNIIILIITAIIININLLSFADNNGYIIESSLMDGVNQIRMTYAENITVDAVAQIWAYNNSDLSDYEKIFAARDYLIDISVYNVNYLNPVDILYGRGNCQSYSLMFRALMKACAIPVEIVVDKPLGNPKDKPTHMWNRVEMYGEIIDFDITAYESLFIK